MVKTITFNLIWARETLGRFILNETMQHGTETLYLADCLPIRFPGFFAGFELALKAESIPYVLLPGTKDVWVRDYMPVQVSENKFLQFRYDPDYLKGSPKWQSSITDTDSLCKNLKLDPEQSDLVVDGGNIIRYGSKVILCDKVIRENCGIDLRTLMLELSELLEADPLIFIPTQPGDIIGHADGIVRFISTDNVFINDFRNEDKAYAKRLKASLESFGLDFHPLAYNPYENKSFLNATGIYINYLEITNTLFLPVYGLPQDEVAIRQMEKAFPFKKIVPVMSKELAKEGGVLNCVSWVLKRFESSEFSL